MRTRTRRRRKIPIIVLSRIDIIGVEWNASGVDAQVREDWMMLHR